MACISKVGVLAKAWKTLHIPLKGGIDGPREKGEAGNRGAQLEAGWWALGIQAPHGKRVQCVFYP